MAAHRFQVGDRVRAGSATEWYQTGDRGTVQEEGSEAPWVQFDAPYTAGDGLWAVPEGELELLRRDCAPAARTHTLPEDSAARKRIPLFTGPVLYFPAALAAVAKLCMDGNDKHNPGEPMHHARGKSADHDDCIMRHSLDKYEGDGRDKDGTPHVVMRAWRALADCQEWLEKHDGAPMAPGAKEPG